MRRAVTVMLLLATLWLLYDGEAYVHDVYEGASAFMPYEKGAILSFRDFTFRGRGTERHAYLSVEPEFRRFTETAHAAGTWLFVSLAIAAAALALSFIPPLASGYWIGAGVAVLSIGVYAIWMGGAA